MELQQPKRWSLHWRDGAFISRWKAASIYRGLTHKKGTGTNGQPVTSATSQLDESTEVTVTASTNLFSSPATWDHTVHR